MKKRTFSIFMMIILLVGIIPIKIFAEENNLEDRKEKIVIEDAKYFVLKDEYLQDDLPGKGPQASTLFEKVGDGKITLLKGTSAKYELHINVEGEDKIQSVVGDGTPEYDGEDIIWYAVKKENDGWHVDGFRAKHEQKYYDIVYLANGYGVDNSTMPLEIKKIEEGESIYIDNETSPTRQYDEFNWMFKGWSTSEGEDNFDKIILGEYLIDDLPDEMENGKPTGRKCLWASWERGESITDEELPKEEKYKISYHSNYGSDEVTVDENPTNILKAISRDEYVFKEWNTLQNGTGKKYAAGSKYEDKEDLELFAQWKKRKSNNGSGVEEKTDQKEPDTPIEELPDEEVNLPKPPAIEIPDDENEVIEQPIVDNDEDENIPNPPTVEIPDEEELTEEPETSDELFVAIVIFIISSLGFICAIRKMYKKE